MVATRVTIDCEPGTVRVVRRSRAVPRSLTMMKAATSAVDANRSQRYVGRGSHESMRTTTAFLIALFVSASMHVMVRAQNAGGAGQNINLITGSKDQFRGDLFRQRQNEPM